MDADVAGLFAESVRSVLERVDGARVVTTLVDDGWDEVHAEDPAFVVGTLFEAAARRLTDAPVFDLLTPPERRSRPVFPRLGGAAAGSVVDGRLVVDGLAIGPDVPAECAVGVAGGDLPSPGHVVVVGAGVLGWERVEGVDPDAGVWRVRGDVPVGDAIELPGGPPWPDFLALLRRAVGHTLVGLGEQVAESVHEYVLTRTQFGRPVGSWQTVQHRLADVHVALTGARATLDAAWRDPRPLMSAAAKHEAGVAAATAIGHAQQLFGAIGFTWEHGLHRYVRRLHVLEALAGSGPELAAEVAASLRAHGDWEPAAVGW